MLSPNDLLDQASFLLSQPEGDSRLVHEQAIDLLNEALDSDPDPATSIRILTLAASLHTAISNDDEAIVSLEQLLDLPIDPATRPAFLYQLAALYAKTTRHEDAEGAALEALELPDVSPGLQLNLHYLLATVLHYLEREDEAPTHVEAVLAALDAGVTPDPNGPTEADLQVLRDRATSKPNPFAEPAKCFKAGDHEGAKQHLLALAATQTDDDILRADTLNFLAECHLELGAYDDAIGCYDQVNELDSADEHARYHARTRRQYASASRLFAGQSYAEALAAYRALLPECNRDDEFKANVMLRCGLSAMRSKDNGTAKDFLVLVADSKYANEEQKQLAYTMLTKLPSPAKSLFGWLKGR